ncbi:MAG: hypothetical protein AAF571_08970 [Verrucomicrobiota bacterium]
MLEGFADSLRKSLGAEPAGDRILVDECQQGLMTYRLEIEPETLSCKPRIRFIATEFKGSGSAGKTRKSFSWTVSDNAYADLHAMTSKVLAAADPEAEVIDVRGVVGRWFDQLTGVRHVNHVPVVAEQYGPAKQWIEATLSEDKYGILVTFYVEYQGRSPLSFRVPLATIQKLYTSLQSLL